MIDGGVFMKDLILVVFLEVCKFGWDKDDIVLILFGSGCV